LDLDEIGSNSLKLRETRVVPSRLESESNMFEFFMSILLNIFYFFWIKTFI